MDRLRGITTLLLCFLLFSVAGAGITTYDIHIEDDDARINVSFELYTSLDEDGEPREINYWETSWTAPENSEIVGVSDTIGEIDEYTFNDGVLRFQTNSGPRRSKEVVDVQLVTHDVIKERYNGANLLKLQLSGFSNKRDDVPDEVTQVTVETDERLLSESHSYGFDHTLDRRTAVYRGEGPVNLHLTTGDGGEEYEHYVLFGDANLTESDEIYWLAPAITGFVPEVNKYPVIVLPDEEYDERIDSWSAGQYRTGGLIFIRETTAEKDELPAIVLHEVMHAYNEHVLRWTNKGLAWFDEGTAKYVEYLVKYEKNIRQAEIFGEDVTWTGPCRDQAGRCRYVLNPRGTPDQLWEYYRSDSDMMYSWSPSTSSTPSQRTFGYAFSELLFRNLVRQEDLASLQDIYNELLAMDRETEATKAAETTKILGVMDTDFTPCYDEDAPSRNEFESCLEQVNSMEPPTPSSVTIQNETRRIDIQPIERPDPPESVIRQIQKKASGESDTSTEDLIRNILYAVGTFFEDLVNNLFKAY